MMNGIVRFTLYLFMALQCPANGRVAGTGEQILGSLNPHVVSSFNEMGIDSRSTATGLLKRHKSPIYLKWAYRRLAYIGL